MLLRACSVIAVTCETQAGHSQIIVNAHRIPRVMPELGKPEAQSGFYLVESCEFNKEPSSDFSH